MKNIKAVIMTGGFGTRLQPLTYSIPKPMVPVINKPIMEHTIKRLSSIGIKDIVILLYFKPEIIKNYFKDGSKWGVNINYVLPDKDFGTAGAVKQAEKFLDTTFIVVSGDVVCDFDYERIIEFHIKNQSPLTLALTSVENPLQFGVVITNNQGRIEKFVEKPTWGEVISDTINTGIYIIEPEILKFIPTSESFDFAKNLFPLLMRNGIKLMGINMEGYWRDVGNPDSYRAVHNDIFYGRVNIEFSGKKIEYPDGVLYLPENQQPPEGVKIIDTVVLGENVTIEKNAILSNVAIGDNVSIGSSCSIRNSVIWQKTAIGSNTILDNAVICNDCKIGSNVVAKYGLILSESCEVGNLTTFEQDVVVWPNKKIDAASIVKNNVIWGSRHKNSLFENNIITGKSNVEISCDIACKIGEAFGSQLPEGSRVIVGRDYENSPRMIKRAFVSGLLATGIEVIDFKATPPTLLRWSIANDPQIAGGAYIKRALYDPNSIEILLFNEHGLKLSSNSSKAVDKCYFKEEFRRVEPSKIGQIIDYSIIKEEKLLNYITAIQHLIDFKLIRDSHFRVAVDLMFGIAKDIFPYIITQMQIENILLNAYSDPSKLKNIEFYEKKSLNELSNIVKKLGFDLGIVIYPHSQRLRLIDEKGNPLDTSTAVHCILNLMNLEGKRLSRKIKVLLPSWSADLLDNQFEFLDIKRGRMEFFTIEQLKEFDLIAKTDGNCSFVSFSLFRDAVFSSFKIMELLSRHKIKLSKLSSNLKNFFYRHISIDCPQLKKGKILKRFIEHAKDKPYSTIDGVKINETNTDWVMILPDAYQEKLNLYVQAIDNKAGEVLLKHYKKLIQNWINEN
ncbi:sugar phosphate nucleotidyltransferase [Hippea jasoniae]|uniref:sugar phosphate nucleotidyltransferase n=1 Tax=Hippea jasoniae TaxID=944479 RepID=UPI0006907419|nr:sugar phosphate nucleotidyltransferase [Hippea jasoniae]